MKVVPGLRQAARLVAAGGIGEVAGKVRARLDDGFVRHRVAFGLSRDLAVPFPAPSARVPIAVREIAPGDLPYLVSDRPDDTADERREHAERRAMLDSGLRRCFVAVDERSGEPCYMQWLIGSEANDTIRAMGCFPLLAPDEALLENAYTPPTHRGKGIMPAAMALIAERASEIGARRVWTFVTTDNYASLKGCRRAGFAPAISRRQSSYGYGLVRTVGFGGLPADLGPSWDVPGMVPTAAAG